MRAYKTKYVDDVIGNYDMPRKYEDVVVSKILMLLKMQRRLRIPSQCVNTYVKLLLFSLDDHLDTDVSLKHD